MLHSPFGSARDPVHDNPCFANFAGVLFKEDGELTIANTGRQLGHEYGAHLALFFGQPAERSRTD